MDKKITYLVVTIVVAIIAILAFNIFLKKEVEEVPVVEDSQVEIISINSILTPDQAGGEEVFIEKVLLKTDENGGFVVVHRVAEDGALGGVIGVSEYLTPGVHDNFVITLDEGETVEVGENVIVMLHGDNGDGVFNPKEDGALVDGGGNVVMISFTILDNLEEVEGFEAKL
ncbi:MAG: hypothetical protein KAR24_01510 [Candidatus Pacebacteria bacterium]|nr:hypothetical protein [Candidatus Paceibacterota bacterium]